jgi:hypothetical protein
VERFSALFGAQVQFSYTALDRIVLTGYLERLQRPEHLVYFFHEVAGVPCIEPAVLAERTDRYRNWVRRYTEEQGIPVLPAAKGERKEEVVQPYYRRLRGKEGVACVLTSMEQDGTFVSYTRYRTSDPNYRRISRCRKQFLHYYFYVWDEVAGPMSLRVATYLPFNLTCYLNGHSFIARALERLGVGFRKEDNAILAAGDLQALEHAATELTPERLGERCAYWAARLAPDFGVQERTALGGSYRYSIAQVEVATDVIFKRSAPLKAMFARAVELGLLNGGADRTTHLFGRQINRRYRGKLQTVLERRDEGHPVLRSYYRSSFVKQYEKEGRLLRTETCVNNTYDLGIRRRIEHLPELVERMAKTNDRYLEVQAELLDTTVDAGQLAELAAPSVMGKRRVPGIKLEDDRVIRLLAALLHPGGLVADWTTGDVQKRICQRERIAEADYRLSQLRYDLSKLRAKGLVERIGKSRRYTLTAKGIKLGTLLVKLRTLCLGPLCAAAQAPARQASTHPSAVETAIRQVGLALDNLCRTLGLAAA